MRTKTLLIASAVALAAAVTSTQAQTVYSQNIVGYVNQTFATAGGSYFITAPVQGTNTQIETLMASSLQSFDNVLIWNGNGYNSFLYLGPNNGNPTGEDWDDANGNAVASPTVAAGQGFFYQTLSGNVETNTWTGTCVLSNEITLPTAGGSYAVASTPPIASALEGTNINLPLQPFDNVLIWNGNGYNSFLYLGPNNGNPTGEDWDDANGNAVASPTVNVGQAFFYQTLSGNNETWTQNDSYINP
jgi:hypothetical protein